MSRYKTSPNKLDKLQMAATKRHKKAAQVKRKREKERNILEYKMRLEKKTALKNAKFIPKDRKEFEEQFLKINGMTAEEFNKGVVKR